MISPLTTSFTLAVTSARQIVNHEAEIGVSKGLST